MRKKNYSIIIAVITLSSIFCQVNASPQDLKWNFKLTGLAQHNTVPLTNWYTIDPSSYYNESAANGLDGLSFGLDIGLEYMVSKRIGIEGSISYIPTKIQGGTHYTTREIFSEPTGFITFLSVKIIANFYLKKSEKHNISIAPIIGKGFIGELDLYPAIGKSRHFNGKNDFLYGGQISFNHKFSGSRWSLLTSLRYMKTTYEVSEIETGDLRMDLPMALLSLQFGTSYSF